MKVKRKDDNRIYAASIDSGEVFVLRTDESSPLMRLPSLDGEAKARALSPADMNKAVWYVRLKDGDFSWVPNDTLVFKVKLINDFVYEVLR